MTELAGSPVPDAAPAASLRYASHIVCGVAIGLVAPFTGLAWPFAILTGFVIGRSDVERSRGIRPASGTTIVRLAAVTGGVLAMMIFGAVIGGLISFLAAALAGLSERAAAGASPTDRAIARVIVVVVAVVTFVALAQVIGLRLDIRVGS